MSTDKRFDESITSWLEHSAPARLPDRVLAATFERTSTSKQQVGWRAALGRMSLTRSMAALGGTAAVVTIATALALGSFVAVAGPSPSADATNPVVGTWFSTSDADGGKQTMTVRVSAEGVVEIVVTDDIASVCSLSPSRMAGTGRLEGDTKLVIPAPVYTCDDGSEPQALSGPPLNEQLRNLTFVRDAQAAKLTDNFGGVWTRSVAAAPSPEPTTSGGMWPQSSLEEVRQAQALADAGDPAYAWQLGQWYQPGQHHPMNTAFFARFLEAELGWEKVLWDEAFAHPDGLDDGDVVYVRCAPVGTNPLYPDAPEGGCAPTIDELRYETVKINVAQLARQGAPGIWVVTAWEMIEPAVQIAPPSDAEIEAFLEPFLQARIDGEGAEDFADFAEDDPFVDERVVREVPLLYATSSGAPYERSEFEIVDGPVWPEGRMQLEVRLFAENGATVVRQVFSLEPDETRRLRLVYDFQPMGPAGSIPATTENGKAVPVEYGFLDGEVTYRAAYPLEPSQDGTRDRDSLAIDGLLPDDDAPRRILAFQADPRLIGTDCVVAPAPADAEALAQRIRSDPDLQATAPVAVIIGGIPALQMDLSLVPAATPCSWPARRAPRADRARLYLVDLPGGSAEVLAITITADEDSFETVLAWAAPIVDSIEFHVP